MTLTFNVLDNGPSEPETKTLIAWSGKNKVGSLMYQFGAESDTLFIGWIVVPPKFQRQGVATALVKEIRERFKGKKIDFGAAASQEGEKFLNKVCKK